MDTREETDRPRRGELDLPPLPPYIQPGLKVLFIGFNPGERSAQLGHYYAYPGNRFWWLLHQAGLTERQLAPTEDAHMLELGYGLTDIVARPSKSSGDLAGWELREGRAELIALLGAMRPRVACYNGKGVYTALSGKKGCVYGLQPDQVVAGVLDFVAASPSGRSREPVAVKLDLYCQLTRLLNGINS